MPGTIRNPPKKFKKGIQIESAKEGRREPAKNISSKNRGRITSKKSPIIEVIESNLQIDNAELDASENAAAYAASSAADDPSVIAVEQQIGTILEAQEETFQAIVVDQMLEYVQEDNDLLDSEINGSIGIKPTYIKYEKNIFMQHACVLQLLTGA